MIPFSYRQKRFRNQSSEAAIFKSLTLGHSSTEIIRCGGNVMARFFKKREETKGLSPGSLVFVGNKKRRLKLIVEKDTDNAII